jgi:hypothetical protein
LGLDRGSNPGPLAIAIKPLNIISSCDANGMAKTYKARLGGVNSVKIVGGTVPALTSYH